MNQIVCIDNMAYRFPVSVKGVVESDRKILLLKNEREEWELPGGKLELGEDPTTCVAREISEETDMTVIVGDLLDIWVYSIREDTHVLIASYSCQLTSAADIRISHEHKEGAWFSKPEIKNLKMPQGYKNSIALYFSRTNND